MDYRLLPLYFIVGGTLVTLVTYFGSQGKGLFAAFTALFPSITVITLCTVYFNSGSGPTISYAKSLVALIPAWLIYVAAVIYLLPRLGLFPPLAIGILLYAGVGYLTTRFV
jgi:uncharacterized membrane protein (GlpM family)